MLYSTQKKLAILAPILPVWSEIKHFAENLMFLQDQYKMDFIDPLQHITHETTQKEYIVDWQKRIENLLKQYDLFFGFSLGGVLLQMCFALFAKQEKKIVLFSTPSYVDQLFYTRLNTIVELIKENLISRALTELNQQVFHPYHRPSDEIPIDTNLVSLRLSFGLKFILGIDSRDLLEHTAIKYLHLIGAESWLVNEHNVFKSKNCQLISVPRAGMRVLQDNLPFCAKAIKAYLNLAH